MVDVEWRHRRAGAAVGTPAAHAQRRDGSRVDGRVSRAHRDGYGGRSVRSTVRGGVIALFALTLFTQAALANSYAGWSAAIDKLGVKGYVKQPSVGSVSGEFDGSWLGVCAYSCTTHSYADGGSGLQWVQLGMYQGTFAAGTSTSSVHMYYENMDPCGDYFADDIGAPPSNPYRFVVWYPGGGAKTFHCSNGIPFTGYTFNYRKGAASNTPFFYGVMGTSDGRVDANTEWHGTPDQGENKFGCSSTSCDDTDYAIEVLQHDGVSWVNSWSADTIGPSNPPYRHTFHNYWAFKTCKAAC